MIKVLLVEDDKLVRKSLITSLDWQKYNMKIVGDAKNGEKALEFMENHKVDLLITDLAMPIMSGIELIRRVKKLYPSIYIVVLSLHQDFEYIQEAMRLGAIDYIAKVELDTENMDKTLKRIHDRILEEQKNHTIFNMLDQSILNGIFIISENSLEEYVNIIKPIIHKNNMMFIGPEVLFISLKNSDQFDEIYEKLSNHLKLKKPLLLVKVGNNQMYKKDKIIHFIQQFKEHLYFYEVKPKEKISIISMDDLNILNNNKDLQKNKINAIKEYLRSMKWVFDNVALENMLKELKELRLRKHKLNELLVVGIMECQRLYSPIISKNIELPNLFSFWEDIEIWFRRAQETIYDSIFHRSISNETYEAIFEAINFIDENLSSNLTTTEIAEKVHMSRSYFCICFKEVVGKTFNEYIQIARISKAIHYLIYTNKNISTISEKVGYSDPKYFSKVFKKITGLLPSEYKKQQEV